MLELVNAHPQGFGVVREHHQCVAVIVDPLDDSLLPHFEEQLVAVVRRELRKDGGRRADGGRGCGWSGNRRYPDYQQILGIWILGSCELGTRGA